MKMDAGTKLMPLLILLGIASVALAGGGIVEAELHEDVTNAFANPTKTSHLPRVLIIGDSISIGYTDPVRGNLKGIADVFRPSRNCQDSGVGVAQIKNWLGTNQCHFNALGNGRLGQQVAECIQRALNGKHQ